MRASTTINTQQTAMLTVAEAAEILGVGRTMAYTLISTGAWPTPVVRVGRLIKIPAEPLHRLVSTGSSAQTGAA